MIVNKAILQVQGLTFGYPGEDEVLKNISFQLEKNQATVLLGRNGAGKSTLMFNLLGLLHPQSGEILFNGEHLTSLDEKRLRQKLAYIFQNPDDQVFAPTVREDIFFGPEQFGIDLDITAERLERVIHLLQIEPLLERNPRHLSYGEKRRVALAGVLIMEPEIIFFDEPLAFLDPPGRELFVKILDQLISQGTSLFVATHDLNFAAEWGERFLILDQGQIIDHGDRKVFQQGISAFNHSYPLTTKLFQGFVDSSKLPVTIEEGRCLLNKLLS